MVRIDSYTKGDDTIEVMNNLVNYLLKRKMVKCLTENSGVQECSEATCDFEVHVIRKR